MAKTILITNDDGIDSDGIIRLATAAKDFGVVYVVAPDGERSAASHSITLRHEINIYNHDFPVDGVHAFSCSGTPADCIRVGSLAVMEEKPDIVLSGINFGYNVATDVQYSATVGAALEGAFQGIKSISLSEGANSRHEVTDFYLHDILEELIKEEYLPGYIHNVNFPECKLSECKGVLSDRKISAHSIYVDSYRKVESLKDGGASYMVEGKYTPVAESGTDYEAILSNYVSIGLVKTLYGLNAV